jgi:hypothetical protein
VSLQSKRKVKKGNPYPTKPSTTPQQNRPTLQTFFERSKAHARKIADI